MEMLWHKDKPCPVCGKLIGKHTKEQIKKCLNKAYPQREEKDYD